MTYPWTDDTYWIASVERLDVENKPRRQSIALKWDDAIKWQWTYFDRVDQDWRNAGIRMAKPEEIGCTHS